MRACVWWDERENGTGTGSGKVGTSGFFKPWDQLPTHRPLFSFFIFLLSWPCNPQRPCLSLCALLRQCDGGGVDWWAVGQHGMEKERERERERDAE